MMSDTELREFEDSIDQQGGYSKRTAKGIMFYFPDGSQSLMHFTSSDPRAMLNQRAMWLRHGLVWPLDGVDKKATKSLSNKEQVQLFIESYKDDEMMGTAEIAEALSVPSSAVRRWMTAAGFKQFGRPEDGRKLFWAKSYTVAVGFEQPEPVAEPVKVQKTGDREFIDSHDSWVMDLTHVDGTSSMAQFHSIMVGLNLAYEIRVWKREETK